MYEPIILFGLKLFSFSYSVETFAIARNVEDLAAAKITPMIPTKAAVASGYLSRESFTSKLTSKITSSLASGMVSLTPDLLFLFNFPPFSKLMWCHSVMLF